WAMATRLSPPPRSTQVYHPLKNYSYEQSVTAQIFSSGTTFVSFCGLLNHLADAAGRRIDAQCTVYFLLRWLGLSRLAHMQGLAVVTLKGGRDTALRGQG